MDTITFDPGRFVEMLPKMGIGMLVIFVIIGAIIITTMGIDILFSDRKKKKDDK